MRKNNDASKNQPTLSYGTALTHRPLPPFNLINHSARPFTNQSLKDHWSFMFFGYTQCPKLCPDTLKQLNQVARLVKKIDQPIQFIFITINPTQDTPQHLAHYFSTHFKEAHFMGGTGPIENIQNLANQIGIYVAKNNVEVNGHIEHSGTVLLINPEGELAAVFVNTANPSAIVQDFKRLIQ